MQNMEETATLASTAAANLHDLSDLNPATDYRIVIGMDEAGYGPNIGPMLVAGTAWRVPKSLDEPGFIRALGDHFHTTAWSEDCQHIPLGDSKQLYSPATGLRTLEAGLLAMVSHVCPQLTSGSLVDLLGQLDVYGPWAPKSVQTVPQWLSDLPNQLPLHVSANEIARLSQKARQRLAECGIELLAVRAAVVLEAEFNRAVAQLGSKGRLLSNVTMQLAMQLLSAYPEHSIEVFCDRQGGRKKYACVLLEAMPDDWFDTLAEQPERSSYRRQRTPGLTFHFSVGGDSFPPTALASMTAKYLRERLMAGINGYWQKHIADLQPTAGYPLDAKRFRSQIERKAAELGHAVDQWWRVC